MTGFSSLHLFQFEFHNLNFLMQCDNLYSFPVFPLVFGNQFFFFIKRQTRISYIEMAKYNNLISLSFRKLKTLWWKSKWVKILKIEKGCVIPIRAYASKEVTQLIRAHIRSSILYFILLTDWNILWNVCRSNFELLFLQ